MKIKLFDIIILLIVTILLIIVYIGFYFPDEWTISENTGMRVVLFSIRVLFPISIPGFIYIYICVKKGKIAKSNIYLSLISTFITLIIILSIILISFSFKNKTSEQFHPFLQLMPNPIDTNALNNRNTFRIVCIGGSTTEFKDGKGMDWPQYLELYLKKIDGLEKVKVFNCGKQWYSTLHMLIYYVTNIRPFRPDILIIMEAINDLLINADRSLFSRGEFRMDYGHFYGPVKRIADKTLSFKYLTQKEIFKLWYQEPLEILELDSFPGLASYRRNIETIIDLARIDGTKVILMTQPTLYKEKLSIDEKRLLTMVNVETVGEKTRWSHTTAWRGMEQYNNKMRYISKEQNVFLIDLEKVIPKSNKFFWDDVHYRDEAYPLITKTIAETLILKSIIDIKKRKVKTF